MKRILATLLAISMILVLAAPAFAAPVATATAEDIYKKVETEIAINTSNYGGFWGASSSDYTWGDNSVTAITGQVSFKSPVDLSEAGTIVLHYKGTAALDARIWFVGDGGSGYSNGTSTHLGIGSGEFDYLIELTATDADVTSADTIVFRSASGQSALDLTLTYLGIFEGTMEEYEAALEYASSVQPDEDDTGDDATNNEVIIDGKTYTETVIYDTDVSVDATAWSWNTPISYNTTPSIGEVVVALQEENAYIKIVASNTSSKVMLQSEAGTAGLNAPTFTTTDGDNIIAYYLGTALIEAYIAETGAAIEDGFWNLVIQPTGDITISVLDIVKLIEVSTDYESDSNTVTVYFDANGGSGTMESLTLTKGDYFSPYAVVCEFTPPEGKVFGGWSATVSGEWFGAGAVTDDIYVTAIWHDPLIASLNCYLEFPVAGNNPNAVLWTIDDSYKYEYLNWLVLTDDGWVTFDGVFESGKTYSVTIELSTVYDHVFDAPENYLENSYFMDFKFDGSIPSQTHLTFDSIYANGDNLVIYKEFTLESDSNVVKVYFDANGGSGTMESLTLTKGDYFYPYEVVCEFTPPEGYIFLSWNVTDADGNYVNTWGQNVSEDLYMSAGWTPKLIDSIQANVEFPITGLRTSAVKTTFNNSYQSAAFTWEILEGDTWVAFDGVFEEGNTYRVSVELVPINGAYFDDVSVYTNVTVYDSNRGSWETGASVIADEVYADGDNIIIVKEFTPIVKNIVSTLQFSEFTLPEYGTTIGEWLPSVADGLGYYISSAAVYTMPKDGTSWTICTAEDIYTSDNYYYYQVYLSADDMYCFNNTDVLDVSINGVSSGVNTSYGYNWPSSRYNLTANITIDGVSNTVPETDSDGVILSEETEFFSASNWSQYGTCISTANFVSALATPGAYFVITRSEPCTGVDYPDTGYETFKIMDSFWSGSYPQSDGTTTQWLSLGTANHTKAESIAKGYPNDIHIDCVLDDGLNVWYDASEVLEAWTKGNFDTTLAKLLVVSNTSAVDVYDIVRIAVVVPDGDLEIPEEPEEPEETKITASGTCGDSLTWELTSDGVLTISGEGAMTDYNSSSSIPWDSYRSSIKSVIIEDGVTSIGEYAFWYCTNLTSVAIPDSVTSIGYFAFEGSSSLTSIDIPHGVTSIGLGAFSDCSSLMSINVSDENLYYTDIDGVLFNKSCTELVRYTEGKIDTYYMIPNSVTSIGWGAFWQCSSLTSITIPDSVTSIGYYAFYNCSSLTSVIIPDSVTSIGWYAFDGCSNLTSATIGKGVTSIGRGAFEDCSNLTNITFMSHDTVIYDSEVTIPDTATIFGYDGSTAQDYAEKYNRTFISIGEAPITTLASGTCGDNLTWELTSDGTLTISGEGAMTDYNSSSSIPWDSYRSLIKTVIIEDGVTSIGEYAFWYCTNLTSVAIPDSVTSIGYFAFEGCSSLTSIDIPHGVTSIGWLAFYSCSSLTSITIPNSVISIDNSAFYNCSSLESIYFMSPITVIYDDEDTISDTATIFGYDGSTAQDYAEKYNRIFISIGEAPITTLASGTCGDSLTWELTSDGTLTISGEGEMYDYGWVYDEDRNGTYNGAPWYVDFSSPVTTVMIENGVTSIGNNAFYFCSYLTDIQIPDTVTSIGSGAFWWCTSLTNITIPDSVTSIGDSAFWNCSSLTSVTISDSVTSIGDSAFYYCSGLAYINVSDENLYYTDIDGVLFNKSCTELVCYPAGKPDTSYTIPDSVTSIGDYAFEYCSSLTSVTIPDSVTSIGNDAFRYCSSLTHINVSDENLYYTDINGVLFNKSCTELVCYPAGKHDTSYTIPHSVTSIGESAFYNCSSLTSITIPDSVTSIGESAFTACSSLTSITIPDSVTSIGWFAFYCCSSLESIYFMSPDTVIYDDEYTISDTATIYGYEGSTAQNYAEMYGRNFVSMGEAPEEEIPTGNLNGDDKLDNKDALHLLYYVLFPEDYPVTEECDYNNDGVVDRNDALYLLYHVIFGAEMYPLK